MTVPNNALMASSASLAPAHESATMTTDHAGNPLEAGAMYCCTFVELDAQGDEYEIHGNLVRYIGTGHGRLIFADADDWREIDCEFDKLIRQACPIVDPAAHGWGEKLH